METGQGLRIAGHFLRQKLQRYEAAQSRIFRFVDNAHAPAAEFFDNAIMRNCLPNHLGRILRLAKPASQ